MAYKKAERDKKEREMELKELTLNWNISEWREFRNNFWEGDYYAEKLSARKRCKETGVKLKSGLEDWFRRKRRGVMIDFNNKHNIPYKSNFN